jgi:hypothetical protein
MVIDMNKILFFVSCTISGAVLVIIPLWFNSFTIKTIHILNGMHTTIHFPTVFAIFSILIGFFLLLTGFLYELEELE